MDDNYLMPYKYENIMEHKKWINEIPFIIFPHDWQIQVSPPFGGAVVRFRVKNENAHVSVYLDCYDKLGFVGSPYWEVYPHCGDVFRCYMKNTDELVKAIAESIEQQL